MKYFFTTLFFIGIFLFSNLETKAKNLQDTRHYPQQNAGQENFSSPAPREGYGNARQSGENQPSSSNRPNDLKNQLLDPKMEKFYSEIIADEYAAFQAIECVSASISLDQSHFPRRFGSRRGLLNYSAYKGIIAEYYEALMRFYLRNVFKELSKQPYKRISNSISQGGRRTAMLVSPFAREMQGYITNSITLAANIAKQIPTFQVTRRPDLTTTFHEYLNALPPERLRQFRQCFAAINFQAEGLNEFKNRFMKDINLYFSKNKSQQFLGETNLKSQPKKSFGQRTRERFQGFRDRFKRQSPQNQAPGSQNQAPENFTTERR